MVLLIARVLICGDQEIVSFFFRCIEQIRKLQGSPLLFICGVYIMGMQMTP